ncbi:anaerobic ribonucleoside-triphosphate reductase activating protein [Candidatus Izemoplasma sp. B36]|uniref:anaerobic ribonucleoside-triphosphate reductase activating protein n=1 Tax=Candidatus Izemoplasma sp. B36 TaxID=3242468 RepID=UPI0035590938
MIFAGITKSSLLDYPGNISIVLYTPGCNYDCFYCHNRELIEDLTEKISIEDIMDLLNKRIGLIDSVVISGGEPTLHFDLIPFLKKVKSMGYLTKLDTNGSNPEVIKNCIEEDVVDYYAVDYKAPASRYKEIVRSNADAEVVLETINLLIENSKTFEVRTTVIPQLSINDLIQMAKELPKLPRYVLNPYRTPVNYLPKDEELVKTPPYSESEIAEMASIIKLYQTNVILPF